MYSKAGNILLIIFLSLGGAAGAAEPVAKTPLPATTDAEAKYFKMRDKLCLSQEVKQGDYQPLEPLRPLAEEIVGTVRVDGFKGEGDLSIVPGYDGQNPCDYLDGLTFSNAHEVLDVTTIGFLVSFLQRHSHALGSVEDVYSLSSKPDDPTTFAVIPVQKGKGQDFVHATLYGAFSDSGPYLPDQLSVEVWVKNRRFTLSAPAKAKAPEIPECSKVWEKYAARIDRADEIYRRATSNGKEIRDLALDKKLSDAPVRIREQGAAAFHACYRNLAQERSVFAPFVEQAQSMVDRIHPE
jgi:hypothetical protein